MAGNNESSNYMAGSLRRVWRNAGTPSDGGSGTYANIAEKGDLLIDTTNAKLYQNTNTQASPTWEEKAAGSGPSAGAVGEMAVAGTGTANSAGVTAKYAYIDHSHALGDHDHSGATKGGSIAMGLVGSMATAGTAESNAAGTGTAPAAIDHAHALGTHDHSSATKGGSIVLAALAADFFTADATGRGKFQTGLLDAATLLDLVVADAFSNANCDAFFAANAFAADADSRAIFADGIWTGAKLADDCLSADTTGRAKMADDYFDATQVLAKFDSDAIDATAAAYIIADNAIPSGKVNWNYGGVGDIVTIVPDASAATGSAAGVARIDHTHAIVCGAPVDGSLAAANAEGSSNEFARQDHAHRGVFLDTVELEFGTSYDAVIGWETADASNHTLVLGLADANQAIHITDKSAIATDWNVAADTHPSIYLHSDTTPATDYLKMYHDGTNAIFEVAGGTMYFATTDTNPAQSGIIRAANDTFICAARNAANGADVSMWKVNASDQIEAGAGIELATNYIEYGTNPATTGVLRVPNNTVAVVGRNAANGADINMWKVSATDLIEPGVGIDLSTLFIQAGTNPASAGILRVPNNTFAVSARNAANAADVDMIKINASDYVEFGASVAAFTLAGNITGGANALTFSSGYIQLSTGSNPAASGALRQANNVALWASRNQANDGDITGWKVNAEDDYEAAADVNLGGNKLYGGTAANADLELNATTNGTVATAYIVAKNMIDATQDSIAVRVKAGAIGDSETNQDDINGEVGIDSSNGRWYFRYGAAWHYCAITAGFQIPAEEKNCPICGKPITVGDAVGGRINKMMSDGAPHGLWCHLSCLNAS